MHLSLERGGELGAHDLGGGVVEGVEQVPRLKLSFAHHHRARRRVEVGHPALAVQHRDGVGDGLHHQAQVALRSRGDDERVHQGAGLVRDLLLQQLGVAAIDAHQIREARGQEREARADQRGRGRGRRRSDSGGHGHGHDPDQPDSDSDDARDIAGRCRDGAISPVRALRAHGRGRAEEQQASVPTKVQRSSPADRRAEGARGVQNVCDATEGQSRHDRASGCERKTRAPEHLDEDHP